jgi:hypothetical protein
MKGLSKDEKRDSLKAFIDDEAPTLATIDRSTAEAWQCPWAGKAIEEGKAPHVGLLAEAGQAVHDAFAAVVLDWVESHGAQEPKDLALDAEFALRHSRPDVQPEALRGGRPSIWQWSRFLAEIIPDNILRFDGGEAIGRSGQLAWDLPDMGVRFTSEIDLLYSGPSPVVLHQIDYKSGWKGWTASAVYDSFQFQSHAALVLLNYPKIECLSVAVWNTRTNSRTWPVEFTRKYLPDYQARIRELLATRARHWNEPPTWPILEKCRICPVAALCPVRTYPIGEKPEDVLKQLVATYATADSLEQHLKAIVDQTKQDVRCGNVWYGRNKPASGRKPNATIYELSTKGDSNGDSDGS